MDLSIQVANANEPPTADEFAAGTTDEDHLLTVAVAPHVGDSDAGDSFVVLAATSLLCTNDPQACAAITIRGTEIDYDPSRALRFQELRRGEQLQDTVTYTIEDQGGLRAAASFTVIVGGRNDWHHEAFPLDVNLDGSIAPIDALNIINQILRGGAAPLPPLVGEPEFYYDTNNDHEIGPIDVLQVVNYLNRSGAGEAELATAWPSPVAGWPTTSFTAGRTAAPVKAVEEVWAVYADEPPRGSVLDTTGGSRVGAALREAAEEEEALPPEWESLLDLIGDDVRQARAAQPR